MSPTARSLALLRHEGWQVAVVERWIPGANVRADLWHFADVLACHPRERRFLLVQATTVAHIGQRLAKVRARPEAAAWLEAGGSIEVHGWCLRNGRWHLRRVELRPQDMAPVVMATPPRQRRQSRWQQQTFLAVLGPCAAQCCALMAGPNVVRPGGVGAEGVQTSCSKT